MFGLLETNSGQHKLSPLGRMVVDPQREKEARARAFLNVPLYKAIFDNYKGGVLPPAAALERDMIALGVAEKQTGRARQVFERSADPAGYFEHGKARLVMPVVAIGTPEALQAKPEEKSFHSSGGGGGRDDLSLDPLLLALLKKIPDVEKGWPAAQRVRWFRTFAMNVSQIYDGEAMDPVELRIDIDEPPK